MGGRPRATLNHEQRVAAFVIRARRVTSHSLWREQRALMEQAFAGHIGFVVTRNIKTGEVSYTMKEEYPPEELMESLAARVRPLTLSGDDLHYSKVLDSIASLVAADSVPDYIKPIETWRFMWDSVATRDSRAQAYSIVTDQGAASDQDLMYAWLYGDVVHADDKAESSKGLGVSARYKASVGIVARIVDLVELTLLMVESFVDEGLLTLDAELFSREVVVAETVFHQEVTAYTSPDGSLPTDLNALDPDVWKPAHDALGHFLSAPDPCVTWRRKHQSPP